MQFRWLRLKRPILLVTRSRMCSNCHILRENQEFGQFNISPLLWTPHKTVHERNWTYWYGRITATSALLNTVRELPKQMGEMQSEKSMLKFVLKFVLYGVVWCGVLCCVVLFCVVLFVREMSPPPPISHTGSPKREMSLGTGKIPGNVPWNGKNPGKCPGNFPHPGKYPVGAGNIPRIVSTAGNFSQDLKALIYPKFRGEGWSNFPHNIYIVGLFYFIINIVKIIYEKGMRTFL